VPRGLIIDLVQKNQARDPALKERAWRDLVKLVERIGYGRLQVEIQDGIPVRAIEAMRSIRLGAGEVP
jgi:hypothetical protein